MNTLILGLPRNGKGLYTAQQGIDELVKGDRPIIGNFAWEKLPWRTRKHELRCGLLSYLEQKYGDTFNAQERIFRISDEATSRFFLYRALNRKQVKKLEAGGHHLVGYRQVTPLDGIMSDLEFFLHKDYQLYVCDHELRRDKNGREVLVSFNPILLEHSGAHLNIADECWKFWPARSWQSTSEADVFYNAQHGKFGDDNLFVTHRHNDLDSVIVDRCQMAVVLTHHGKLRFGRFRRPDVYEAATYFGRPTPSKEPQSKVTFRLDAAGIGACYDTSSGVGVTGRGDADRGARKTGLPFWLLPALLAVVVGLVAWALIKGPHYVVAFFIHKAKPMAAMVVPANTNRPATALPTPSLESTPPVHRRSAEATNELHCTGYVILHGQPQAFLSDGRTVGPEDGLTLVKQNSVVFNGRELAIEPVRSYYEYLPPAPLVYDPPLPSPPAPVNQAIILPAIHARELLPPPRLNGFSQLMGRRQEAQTQSQGNLGY